VLDTTNRRTSGSRKAPRQGNSILDAFAKESAAIRSAMESVTHGTGYEVVGPGEKIAHCYFPLTGVLSVVIRMKNGAGAEVSSVGNEGMTGLFAHLGMAQSPHSVVQQVPGASIRVPTGVVTQAVRRSPQLQQIMQRYHAYSLHFAGQTAACNVLHPVHLRVCRWLLLTHDRCGRGPFLLAQSTLSEMLGVRRQTVSEAAASLQRAGIVSYSRGMVHIRDRRRLESGSCECYGAMRTYYDRTLQPGKLVPALSGA